MPKTDRFKIVSTSDGRTRFPDHMQSVFGGEVDFVAFRRYGRVLGAVVSNDAIKMLAGEAELVAAPVRDQIMKSAQALLATLEAGK